MELTRCMKTVLMLPEEATYVVRSHADPFDGVLRGSNGHISARPCLWYDVLTHLLWCWRCRARLNVTEEWVREEMRKISET